MNSQAEWIRKQNELKAQQDASALQAKQIQSLETTVVTSFKALLRYLDGKTTKTEVVNQLKEIGTPDALKVVEAVNGLHETLKTHKNTDLSEVTTILRDVLAHVSEIPKEHPETPEQREDVKVTNLNDLGKYFEKLEFAVNAVAEKEIPAPQVNVEAPNVKVDAPIVKVDAPDFATLLKPLKDVVQAVKNIAIPAQIKTDTSKIEKKLDKSNELLEKISEKSMGGGGGGGHGTPYVDSTGKHAYVELDNGAIPITGTITASSSTLADFSVNDIEDATTSYFGYTKPDGTWLVKELTDTSVSYATVTNNGAVTTYTDAWTNRATLTYGRFDEAF